MKRLLIISLIVGLGVFVGLMFDGVPKVANAGPETPTCAGEENGDVDGLGGVTFDDAITILSYLFLGDPAELLPLCEKPPEPCVPPGPSTLPDTNQTLCYDVAAELLDCADNSLPSQDGAEASGCSGVDRFVDNGDGTVTDTCTGLMWAQTAADLNENDEMDEGDDADGGWPEALNYAADLELGGHSDWRLPNVAEGLSIIDFTVSDTPSTQMVHASIDYPVPEAGGHTSVFWTSSNLYWASVNAWVVSGRYAGVSSVPKDFPYGFVLAVRDTGTGSPLPDTGQTNCYDAAGVSISCADDSLPGQDGVTSSGCGNGADRRFVDNGDGTVSDTCTGLMWTQKAADLNENDEMDEGDDADGGWPEALIYADDLVLGGHSDWRLPNVAEAFSIIDFTVWNSPSTQMVHASIDYPSPEAGGHTSVFWTSSNLYWDPHNAWNVSGRYANVSSVPKDFPYGFVLAVRDSE